MTAAVYFLEAVDSGYIKIGWTTQHAVRLANISSVLPRGGKLLRLVPGGRDVERGYHEMFATDHVGREWFRPSQRLFEVIEQLGPIDISDTRGEATLPRSAFADRAMVLIRQCACPAVFGEPVPSAIERAEETTGLPHGRVVSLWYGKAKNISAEEWERLRNVALKHSDDVSFLRAELKRLTGEMAQVGHAIERLAPELLQPPMTTEENGDV